MHVLYKMYNYIFFIYSSNIILHMNLLTDTVLRCHGNMPVDDNEEITSLPSPSAF